MGMTKPNRAKFHRLRFSSNLISRWAITWEYFPTNLSSFGADIYIFFFFGRSLRSSLLLRIFECGFWNKKCVLTCQETLFGTVRRCEENWAQKSSFSVKKAQVWFGMIENLLWSAWPLHMKCSFFKVDTMKWLAFFDILIDWLTRAAFLLHHEN
jgi:hypothetical protein